MNYLVCAENHMSRNDVWNVEINKMPLEIIVLKIILRNIQTMLESIINVEFLVSVEKEDIISHNSLLIALNTDPLHVNVFCKSFCCTFRYHFETNDGFL